VNKYGHTAQVTAAQRFMAGMHMTRTKSIYTKLNNELHATDINLLRKHLSDEVTTHFPTMDDFKSVIHKVHTTAERQDVLLSTSTTDLLRIIRDFHDLYTNHEFSN
jgi:hypothetical protein